MLLGIPFAYGAVLRFDGQASLFGVPGEPCYRCLFSEPPPPGLVPSCAEAGVLGVLPGIVGTIQATETIKHLLGRGRTLAGRLLLLDALRMEFRELKIPRDPSCPVCGDDPEIRELIDYERFCGHEPELEDVASVAEIDVHELRRMWQTGASFELLDVREPYEWEICNLEPAGARLVPPAGLADQVGQVSRDGPVGVYCRSGVRSGRAVAQLAELGVDNAVNLRGGILAWAQEIDPSMPVY